MRSHQVLFYILVLSITSALALFYREFEHALYRHGEVARTQLLLERQLQKEKLRSELAQNELLGFQAQIAQLLPRLDQLNLSDAGQNDLAQLVVASRAPAAVQKLKLSELQFEAAREEFRNKNYSEVVSRLRGYIAESPGRRQVEAHALLAESYFLLGDDENSLKVMQTMIQLFPDHSLTGLVLLRMGQILEKKKRNQEAQVLYRMLRDSFPRNSAIQDQVKARLESEEVKEL